MEAGFIGELNESARRIESHRERMVREILSEQPDAAAIERERAAIFALQEAQQRAVIAQLLKEREMLRPEQRAALAQLLLAQRAGTPTGH
jgi:Spy/CpxP family protein refolding chaperone